MSESAPGLGNILNSLMENPEMLQKAMNIASSLASSGVLDDLMKTPTEGGRPSSSANSYAPPQNASPDLSSVGNLLAGLMNDRSKPSEHDAQRDKPREHDVQPPSEHSEHPSQHAPHVGHTERIRLLQSLRPFLPCDKQEKLDFVIKLLGLLEAAERMGLGKLF